MLIAALLAAATWAGAIALPSSQALPEKRPAADTLASNPENLQVASEGFNLPFELWRGAPKSDDGSVPPAAGAPTGQAPVAERIDDDLVYPPPAPTVQSRSLWLNRNYNCNDLEPNQIDESDIEPDAETRVRIAVHHTDILFTAKDQAMNEAEARERAMSILCGIRRYHMGVVKKTVVGKGKSQREIIVGREGRFWADIGYHYLIDWRGTIWEGRKLEKVGANVRGKNPGTIGVALFGDYTRQKPTTAQLVALKQLLAYLVNSQKIDPAGIRGHGDLNADTKCPGAHFSRVGEDKTKYVPAKASPLRRIREELKPLWQRVPHAKSDEFDFALLETGPLAAAPSEPNSL